ncbi:MAG: alcohol dehydrogenase catalytic domain-containing protein [Chloroflexota bacterium]|nr:alcohol dehydrogenase catalytic domain-containing protein [Chloroflexota bacterium]
MKAAMFYGGKDIRVEEVPDPTPNPGEVLIEVKAAGICGSDLHGYRERLERPWFPYPHTAGHELDGVVAALGPGVSKLKVGDRVGIEPLHLIGCGECRWCREGHYEACPKRGMVDGVRRHSSGFAELDVAPEENCYPLPDELSIEAASILDVYSCAVHAVHRVPVKHNYSVVVVGTGPIGLSVAEAYKALGARQVIVVGRRDAILAQAQEIVADEVINNTKVDPVEAVKELTDGEGANVVIEAVGGRAPTFADDVHMVAPNGTLGVIGSFTEPQTLDAREAMGKQIQITWINSYGAWEGVPEFQIAMDMMTSGQFHPLKLITHRFPLDEVAEGFDAAANKAESGAIKVIILP